MDDIRIRKAEKRDARSIAEGIIMAIGDDLAAGIANGKGREAVVDIFMTLALMEDSQYSYRNSFIAEDKDGNTAGIVVAYDGSILIEARRLFFRLAKEKLGWDIRDVVPDGEPDVETDPSEFYLDSLAVWPEFRGKGIATLLIKRVAEEAASAGKPVGLLCADHNDNARRLYERLGFREVGKRPFAGEEMSHLMMQ